MAPNLRTRLAAACLLPFLTLQPAHAWGHDGHSMIDHLAFQYLPADVPAFLHNGESLDFADYMGPEPDRWNGKLEQELYKAQFPDHFIDLEWADLIAPLPRQRFDYFRALEAAQAAHPDLKMTQENIGTQPYQVEELYQRLKGAFRQYRRATAANQDTRPVQTAIMFYAGWLGHYVADGSQPLHTTYQFNGWTGPNPNNYTTAKTIHSDFESGYVSANIKRADFEPLVAASTPKAIPDEWVDYLAYLHHSHDDVEKVYRMEKTGAFAGKGTAEGKAFTEERLAAGAIELRDIIYTAWLRSGDAVPNAHPIN
jgi:hypothetical protein